MAQTRPTPKPAATIIIPTHDRAGYLQQSLASALNQHGAEVRVIVLDNATTDDTPAVVAASDDARVEHVRSETNVGMLGNFLRIRRFCTTEYLCVLQDDDWLLPGFVATAVGALRDHPSAAIAYSNVRIVDAHGATVEERDARCGAARGLIPGRAHLEAVVGGENRVIHLSSGLMRAAALDRCGWFDAPHSAYTLDFNLHFRLAARFDLYALPQVLACVRHHVDQDHRHHPPTTGAIAMLAERIDAVGLLLASGPPDHGYRDWLAQRLFDLNQQRSTLIADAVAGVKQTWRERLRLVAIEIEEHVPPACAIVVADDGQLPPLGAPRRVIPFVERDGAYWGAPEDAAAAVAELERQRAAGAQYFIIAWTAFWVLDHYRAFAEHLTARYALRVRNSRLVIYDLGAQPAR
jgi:glycosyltransferase involved in cell wall biosynthesis